MNSPLLVSAVASLVAWGCSVVPPGTNATGRDPAALPSSVPSAIPSMAVSEDSIPVCDSIPIVAAPEEAYRDTPIYVANEMPTEEVKAWAQTKPGFEEIWIDRDHGGWITVAFSTDAAARQAELATRFPGVGVVAVEVDWDIEQLRGLQQRVAEELSGKLGNMSVGVDILRGRVDIGLGVLTPERIEAVRSRFAGEPVCVSGLDPREAIPERPQPTSGAGWRLLASEDAGEVYRTDIATDRKTYDALWQRIGLTGDPPPVDFESEVVVWFGAVYGSTCPNLRLDDVVLDRERRLIYGRLVVASINGFCSDDARPRAYVVAIERSGLPAPPFGIQLRSEDPPAGAPEERTIVEIDLRQAGRAAGPGDVHPDPSLPEPWSVESGDVIEPDFPVPYRLDVRCGVEWLGRLNSVAWRTDVPAGAVRFVPSEWEPLISDGELMIDVLMQTDPHPRITATAAGHSIVYLPTIAAPPACP
jgi:hypothetical protein